MILSFSSKLAESEKLGTYENGEKGAETVIIPVRKVRKAHIWQGENVIIALLRCCFRNRELPFVHAERALRGGHERRLSTLSRTVPTLGIYPRERTTMCTTVMKGDATMHNNGPSTG